MHSAAVGGSAETIQALLEAAPGAAAWTSEFQHTPLHEACGGRHNHREAVRLLLEAAPHTAAVRDGRDFFPLHWAATEGDADIIQMLLDAGAPGVYHRNAEGDTPLHFMASLSNSATPAAKLLLDACPAVALVWNNEGRLPLDCALRRSHPAPQLSIARLLLPASGRNAGLDSLLLIAAILYCGGQPALALVQVLASLLFLVLAL